MSSPIAPQEVIFRITGAVMTSRVLGIVAELGIADLVDKAPLTAANIAKSTGTRADLLYRILRFLASNGVFEEDADGRFHNTDASEVLRDGVPGSLRPMVRTAWQDVVWDTYRHLPEAIKGGDPAFNLAHGQDFFDYLATNTEIGALFDASMALMSAPENEVLAHAYDFSSVKCVVDVGGGRGGFLVALLTAHRHLTGVLFDQSHVISKPSHLEEAGVMGRCQVVDGNFFEEVPANGDVYVLKRVLHDWDDTNAIIILRSCRNALGPEDRLLVIDAVIKPGNDPDLNKSLDVGIMALTRGRERTQVDFERIFEAAGIRLARVIAAPRPSTMSIVEGCLP